MKNRIKTSLIILFAAAGMASCKGGFSAKNQDSSMVDKKAMDSTSKQNTSAGTLGGPKGDSSSKNDTATSGAAPKK